MQAAVYSYLRFSTPEQIKGDSLRRQLERSHQWCKAYGYTLDDSLTMRDLGLSAYHGLHKSKGALGSFLKAVESGTIQPGSILLVESLDRLSRQDVVDAQTQFLNIINAGIEIVTLMDGYRYSRESIKENWTQLIISLTIMSRANEESKAKADRIGKTWKHKRDSLDKRKLTSVGPGWLRLNKKLQIFEPIPAQVKAIQRIFKDYLGGQGAYTITSRLNKDKVPTLGRAKAWGVSSVKMILHNRSVLGEFQPHSREIVDGRRRRVPEGQPISDYYPRIIEDVVFNAVQARMATKVGKGGRVGFVGNLFQHILYCGECGSKYGYERKQGGKYQYIRCGNSHAGRGCDPKPWPYKVFETAFLSHCAELDVGAILPNGNGRAAKIKAAQLDLEAAQGELTAIEKRIQNYDAAIDTADSQAIIERFVKKLTDTEGEKMDAEKRLSDAQTALHTAQSETASTGQKLKSLKQLIQKLETATGTDNDRIDLRQKLKNAIGQLVDRIDVFPNGLGSRMITGDHLEGPKFISVDDEIRHLENVGDDPKIFAPGQYNSLVGELSSYTALSTGKEARAFLIQFRAGGYRLVKQDGEGFANITATWNAMSTLTKSKKEVKLKEAINIKSGGDKS